MEKITMRVLVLLALLLPLAANAQSTALAQFPAARYPTVSSPSTTSSASFAWGMSLNSGATYVTSARVTDPVQINAIVRPEAASIGSKGDIYVVDLVNGQWTMQNSSGSFLPWDFVVPNLVPYMEQVTLTADIAVAVFSGKLTLSGQHSFFLGYKANGGNLHYTPISQTLTIAPLSATEQAYARFVTNISPNIIGSRCIACHVPGGLADGKALHIFQQPLTDNLVTNFKTFQTLVSYRGVNYILTKVTGGNAHGGGVQLTANSAEYSDLQSFMTLVAQDVPDLSMPQGTMGSTDPYGSDTYSNNPYGYYQ